MVNASIRLENLRRKLGMNWSELADRLGVSRVMLHYLRSGKKPLSVKLDYRLRQIEDAALLPAAPEIPKQPTIRFEQWMHSLQHRWQQKESDHDEIGLAVRVLFPENAKEILGWLAKHSKSKTSRGRKPKGR